MEAPSPSTDAPSASNAPLEPSTSRSTFSPTVDAAEAVDALRKGAAPAGVGPSTLLCGAPSATTAVPTVEETSSSAVALRSPPAPPDDIPLADATVPMTHAPLPDLSAVPQSLVALLGTAQGTSIYASRKRGGPPMKACEGCGERAPTATKRCKACGMSYAKKPAGAVGEPLSPNVSGELA